MPEPEQGERTEQATPRRREKAKEKGQVARSRELVTMVSMGGVMLMFYFTGNIFMKNMSVLTGNLLRLQHGRDHIAVMRFATAEMLWILMPFLGIAVTFTILTAVLQGGIVLKPLEIKVEKLNPVSGLKRLFSKEGLMNFLKSFFKFLLGAFITYYVVKKAISILPFTAALDIRQIQGIAATHISRAVIFAFTIFFFLAVMDYFFERWKFERSIRMTKVEIKQENKESEGDPLIKSRIKSLQKEMARRRMMQDVPKATVVITNPTHIAVALMYKNNDMSAPKVIAKGTGLIAGKIREISKKHDVPLVEDRPLAKALYEVKIGSYIPEELYRAVAKILAYIYKLKGAA